MNNGLLKIAHEISALVLAYLDEAGISHTTVDEWDTQEIQEVLFARLSGDDMRMTIDELSDSKLKPIAREMANRLIESAGESKRIDFLRFSYNEPGVTVIDLGEAGFRGYFHWEGYNGFSELHCCYR